MPVNTYYILLDILFSLVSIATFIIVATFSRKLTLFSLFFTVIGIIGYNIVFVFEKAETIQFLNYDLSFWVFLGGMVCLVVNYLLAFWAVSIHSKRKKLIKVAKEQYYNKYFALVAKNDGQLLFNIKIRKVLNDSINKTNKRKICKLLKHEEQPSFKLFYENEEVEFNLDKQEIFCKDKVVGYAFVGSYDALAKILTPVDKTSEKIKKVISFFDLSFNMEKDAIMYFDFDKDHYVLSNSMKELLQEEENQLIDAKYQEKIVASDLAIYFKKAFNTEFINKYEYRVKTKEGILKFEEFTYQDKENSYDIVRISNRAQTDINFSSRLNLIEDVKKNYLDNLEFVLIALELNSIAKIADKQLANLLIKNYFMLLKDEYLQNKVYKLEKEIYALLLNKDEAMRIKTDLENNCSPLVSMRIMVDEEEQVIENNVSFILANHLEEKTGENLIKVALNEIFIISESKEMKVYSIYKNDSRDSGYSFEDMVIDLSDDDLAEFL